MATACLGEKELAPKGATKQRNSGAKVARTGATSPQEMETADKAKRKKKPKLGGRIILGKKGRFLSRASSRAVKIDG